MVLNPFRNGIFPLQPTEGSGNPDMPDHIANVSDCSYLKILIPKKMLQKLPIIFAQLKAGSTSKNLLN